MTAPTTPPRWSQGDALRQLRHLTEIAATREQALRATLAEVRELRANVHQALQAVDRLTTPAPKDTQ
jgi:DNA-binding FadR family transcriptional regulator